MVSHMKTTVDIAPPVLRAAKRLAADQGITLRELMEEGLRMALEERSQRAEFTLQRATFSGHGLQPEIRDAGWNRLRDLAYEGRGS